VLKKGYRLKRGYSTHSHEQNFPVNVYPETSALRDTGDVRVISAVDALWFPCTSTQLLALCCTEVLILSKIPSLT
jgi:hypothetical protein